MSLLLTLRDMGYRFVTPTPATHARVLARPVRQKAGSLEDVLGWSLPFSQGLLDTRVEELLREAGALKRSPGGLWRSTLRVSSLQGQLYLHSAFPTDQRDAVFFGPDSYRFADLITAELTAHPAPENAHIVDIGAGSGVGAIVAAQICPQARLTMTDINPEALRLARINAAAAGVKARTLLGADLDEVEGTVEVMLANPPYIADSAGPRYRDGGGLHGGAVTLDMTRTALDRLSSGGRLILYTGSAIVDGADPIRTALLELVEERNHSMRYREIDPDVFGEELGGPAYHDVDRIAVVAAVITANK